MAGFKGHLRGGIICSMMGAAWVVMVQTGGIKETIINVGIITSTILLGSLLPDIDHPQSFLGRRVRPLSRLLYGIFGHRTLTHCLLFIGGLTYGLVVLGYPMWGIGLGIGMLSHSLLDFFCLGSGVAFLYPIYPKKIRLPLDGLKRVSKQMSKAIKKTKRHKKKRK